MKLSDFVIDRLFKEGVEDLFIFSGGGCMHLIDSVGRHGKMRYVCNLHEQAGSIAAEGYARLKNTLGACLVTTGPGGTNAVTGVTGSWLDSVPVIYISGQVKREMMRPFPELRQLGDQEINIVDIVRPITKYAVTISDPEDIRYHLEKAFYLACAGRPGPVWIDIPLDVQSAEVDEETLRGYHAEEYADSVLPEEQVKEILSMIQAAERPVVIAGKGIRIAGAQEAFLELVDKLKIPVITSFSGYDIIEQNNSYYQGRQGTIGQRAGNLIVQNSDFLLCLGTRMNTRMTGYNYDSFARAAKKVIVDIDPAEHKKPTIVPDISIVADAKDFIICCLKEIANEGFCEKRQWLDYCRTMNAKYQIVSEANYAKKGMVDGYAFIDRLSTVLDEGEVIVLANGFACTTPYQAFKVKKGQRILVNSGCAAMGYDLPAAIGASIAKERESVICIAGDGSIQLNIQELQTIKHYKLPIKIFVFNNNGYLSIRETQKTFFNKRYIAASAEGGVSLPDMEKLSKAYGLSYMRIMDNSQLGTIKQVIQAKEAVVCEVMLDPEQGLATKAASAMNERGVMTSQPLENMAPFLSREELEENMLIPLWEG